MPTSSKSELPGTGDFIRSLPLGGCKGSLLAPPRAQALQVCTSGLSNKSSTVKMRRVPCRLRTITMLLKEMLNRCCTPAKIGKPNQSCITALSPIADKMLWGRELGLLSGLVRLLCCMCLESIICETECGESWPPESAPSPSLTKALGELFNTSWSKLKSQDQSVSSQSSAKSIVFCTHIVLNSALVLMQRLLQRHRPGAMQLW